MRQTFGATISGKSKNANLPFAFLTTGRMTYAGDHSTATGHVVIRKNLNNNKHKIRLIPASDYKTILFSAEGAQGKRYTLFVFDPVGRLIRESLIRNVETVILSEIPPGTDQYEVLMDDYIIENGLLKINNP